MGYLLRKCDLRYFLGENTGRRGKVRGQNGYLAICFGEAVEAAIYPFLRPQRSHTVSFAAEDQPLYRSL
jgi:hypothetical protein